jgi:hypothetical protein
MSATKFQLGKGAVLSSSTDGGTTWTPIKQLKTITFSGSKQDFDDITNLDSPGAVREVVPTLIDPGTADFQGVFNGTDPGQLALSAAFTAQTPLEFKLQFAPGATQTVGFLRTWNGYMASKPQVDAQMDKASTFSGSVKITGPVTDTPAS